MSQIRAMTASRIWLDLQGADIFLGAFMRMTAATLILCAAGGLLCVAGGVFPAIAGSSEKSQAQPADTPQPSSGWYASVTPNEELTGPVYWANTKDEAMAGALRVCQKVSSTCSSRPAWTDTKTDLFSIMCCQKPKLGCAIGVGATEELALQHVRNIFSEAGYSKCKIAKYLSANTGEAVGGN